MNSLGGNPSQTDTGRVSHASLAQTTDRLLCRKEIKTKITKKGKQGPDNEGGTINTIKDQLLRTGKN